ncbi:SDR family oxidoreductase [Ktedonosporobacter rubrisoli]|uniref:SDR family oxidoreductase n=1 Tax=Ktedonosporobacter rubrisoli TaxID=2509675 RepID=A0A4P6JSE3_KTERU|nr:SDR family oxidoreductase [Ktedonosporobacter rubrisoli]QBD78255.1 SDR family oxidoreductase [Ktedonosporobacter rubrisoli]
MELDGQRILIMGGSSGIGLAAARMLTEAGAEVTITGRNQEKINAALSQLGKGAYGRSIDATAISELQSFFKEYGAFDHLVISVSGAAGSGAFHSLNLQDLRHGFEAKFWPQVSIAQLSLETICNTGSITFITAGSSRKARPGTAGLAAINGALDAMIPTLAVELRPLRVNAVSPGVIATPWWDRVGEEFRNNIFAQAAENAPARRIGQPEDVAQAISFLIQNTFVTGSIIDCDGGARLC